MQCFPPERIVCLTEKAVEMLYLLAEESRIVGVSSSRLCGRGACAEVLGLGSFVPKSLVKLVGLLAGSS